MDGHDVFKYVPITERLEVMQEGQIMNRRHGNRSKAGKFPCRRWSLLLMPACFFIQVGCGEVRESNVVNEGIESTSATDQPVAKTASALSSKLSFKATDGNVAFSIKPKDDGAKLVDANEQEMARFNLSGTKLKIKGPDDTVLGYVIASDGKYKIEDADQKNELWKLQPQSDGDWKLEDGKDQLIYKIKVREYGFEIEDGAENSKYKIKLKDDKTSIRDASDKTVYYTKDKGHTLKRKWKKFPVVVHQEKDNALLSAALPLGTSAWFFNIDVNGLIYSSEFSEL